MFFLVEPDAETTAAALEVARRLPPAAPSLLSLAQGMTRDSLPFGFSRDVSRSVLGSGEHAFAAARVAMRRWVEFDLGWVRVGNPDEPVESGGSVAVVAQTIGLWTVNVSRVVEAADAPTLFGFLYATTRMHVEEGQERFVVELDETTGDVRYLIEAASRPRHLLARAGWPVARMMQHRFARDSHARMARAVAELG